MIAELREIDSKVGVWLSVLVGLTVFFIVYTILHPLRLLIGVDFQAFWCGANALLAHANPYVNQPLHACEATAFPALFVDSPTMTIPAPLPPYGLALFVPFALLPYAIARALWWPKKLLIFAPLLVLVWLTCREAFPRTFRLPLPRGTAVAKEGLDAPT